MFNHYYKNIQCKKIFFAGCHDIGYMHELQERQGDTEAKERIVLLETTPAEHAFRSLGFPIVRFDNVFRSEPLKNESKRAAFNAKVEEPTARVVSEVSDASGAGSAPVASPVAPAPPPSANGPWHSGSPSINRSVNGGTSVSYPPSYARVGSSNGHYNISIPVSKSKPKKPKELNWNKNDQRIDPPNKHPSPDDEARFYQKLERIRPNAFCNELYLTGQCKRRACDKVHEDPQLTPGEISVLRYNARKTPCTRGPNCRNFDCYLSHHCPFLDSCRYGSSCKFWTSSFGNLHLGKDDLIPT